MHISGNIQLAINHENHTTLVEAEKMKSATQAQTFCTVATEEAVKSKTFENSFGTVNKKCSTQYTVHSRWQHFIVLPKYDYQIVRHG